MHLLWKVCFLHIGCIIQFLYNFINLRQTFQQCWKHTNIFIISAFSHLKWIAGWTLELAESQMSVQASLRALISLISRVFTDCLETCEIREETSWQAHRHKCLRATQKAFHRQVFSGYKTSKSLGDLWASSPLTEALWCRINASHMTVTEGWAWEISWS